MGALTARGAIAGILLGSAVTILRFPETYRTPFSGITSRAATAGRAGLFPLLSSENFFLFPEAVAGTLRLMSV
jgi:hypothetical protein